MGKLGSYLKKKLSSYFDLNRRAERNKSAEKGADVAPETTLELITELGVRAATYQLAYNALAGVYGTPDKESERLLELAKALAVVTMNEGSAEEISLRENELVKYGRLLRESNAKREVNALENYLGQLLLNG